MIWRISSSRPAIGSISPLRARSVRSTENLAAPPACPSAPAPWRRWPRRAWREPSVACMHFFGRPGENRIEFVRQRIGFHAIELTGDGAQRVAQTGRLGHPDQQMPGADLPVAEHQRRETQARSIDSSICGAKSEIDVAPRGSLSSALVISAASRDGSISKC